MSDKIGVVVAPMSLVLSAEDTAEATATLHNLGESVDQLTLSIEMLDPQWYTLPVSSVALFPNDQDNLKITLHPPKTTETKPGSYPFRVKVVSQENREEEATVDLTIEIREIPSVELAISPQRITGWKGAYNIQVNNPSDAEASVQLSAADVKGKLRYRPQPQSLTVPAGGQTAANLEVRLGWLSLLGGEKEFDFQVLASTAEAEEATTIDGQLVRRPLSAYLPKVRIPWPRRRPAIDTFQATTLDRREFKLSWSVKRASEVKLGDEKVESKGERLVSPGEAIGYVLTASNKNGSLSQTVNVNPIPMPEARASERIRALLSPTRLETAAGDMPVQANLELQNMSDVVDKFSVEIEGIDESWCSRSASSIALMPEASEQVLITLQPPKTKGVKARTYPFAVTVHSQNTPEEVTTILGELEVLPSVEFKLTVRPYRVNARRKGKYRVYLANTSVSDAEVQLQAVDLDEGLKFQFKDENPVAPAWDSIEVPVFAKPKRGSMIGESQRYDITLTATDTAGNSQTVNCEMYHRPFIRSWRTIFRAVRLIVFLGIIGVLIGFAIHWGGGWGMLTKNPQGWGSQLMNQVIRFFGPWFSK